MAHGLRNKKILVTAGPTWVSIDPVRVISNIATGETGILLAEKLQKSGAEVTLLLGQVESCCLNKQIKLLRFKFFDELKDLIVRELKSKCYDVVIHSAAVSDYRPQAVFAKKVRSEKKTWQLKLVPTVKLIDLIRKIDKNLILVGFKFQPQVGKTLLLKEARRLLKRAKSDLIVANSINKNRYTAFILNNGKISCPLHNRKSMADRLVSAIQERIS